MMHTMPTCRQQGFSLIELMIALVIGLIIVLGAGQLFLTGFQSFRTIEDLSIKQSALTFAADVLIKDIRRADSVEGTDAGEQGELNIILADGTTRKYYLDRPDYEDRAIWSLYLDEASGSAQPVVEGFRNDSAFSAELAGAIGGLYVITFQLVSEENDIEFHAMRRSEVFEP
jgi:prepilin-type N-terminal cleavage/methylation domain-containing protein